MPTCIHCGRPAGWFKDRHEACVKRHAASLDAVRELARTAITKHLHEEETLSSIDQMVNDGRLQPEETIAALVKGVDDALNDFLEDELLSEEEEASIDRYLKSLRIPEQALHQAGVSEQIARAAVIRSVSKGEVPPQPAVSGNLPFLFQKSEQLVWAFPDIDYYEFGTRKEYQGGSQGVSIRIMRGVYYRTSAFKGHPVEIDELKYRATGVVALTTKHIYFGSDRTSFKVPYSKIISLETFSDALRVQKDGVRSKPQIFQGLDGWFASNIISNLN